MPCQASNSSFLEGGTQLVGPETRRGVSDGDKKGIGTKLVNRLSLSFGGVGILGQLSSSLKCRTSFSSLTAVDGQHIG